MLGLADPVALRALIEAVADEQTAEGLERIHALVAGGADLRQLTAQYGEEFRALMLARAGADVATIMDRTAEEAQAAQALAERFTLEELAACARVFARNEQPARGLPVPQLALELAFLECVSIRAHGGSYDHVAPVQRSQVTRTEDSPARPVAHQSPRSAQSTQSTAPASPPAPAHEAPATNEAAEAEVADTPEDTPEAAAPMPDISPVSSPVIAETTAATSGAGPQQPVQQDLALLDVLRDIQRRWTMIKKVCKQKSSMVSGLLSDAQPVQLDAGDPPALVVAVKWPFHLEKLREPSKREAVEWALQQVLERPIRVRLVLASEGGGPGQPAARPQGGPKQPPAAPPPQPPDDSAPNNIVPFPTPLSAAATPATRARDAAPQSPAQPFQPDAVALAPQPNQQPDVTTIEREVRADPVIQELMRIGGAELADVRALDDDERS
jgi:DNA polymerase-3 subunit gamma/tau